MRQIAVYLLGRVLKWVFDTHVSQSYEGIRICVLDSSDPLKRQTHIYIVQALELIRFADPKRFRRIQRRLAYIVDGFCSGAGEYHHALRVCYVDLERFDFVSDESWYVLQLARTIVHEATHGEIEAHNTKYSKLNRVRVERICHREEMRFLNRVTPDAVGEDFDQTQWEDVWKQSLWQHGIELVQRLRRGNP